MSQQLFASAVSIASQGDPQPRQAALLLSAMSEHDRAWVLAQLPATERATLLPLLGELEMLGIPVDGELLHAVRTGVDHEARLPEHGQTAASDEEAILRASPAAIAGVLAHEPAELTARLLSIRAWPWQGELMKLLPASRGAGIRTRLERQTSRPQGDICKNVDAPREVWQTCLMRLLRARLDDVVLSSTDAAASHDTERTRPIRRSAWWQRWGRGSLAGRRNGR